jgi:hypothetical protein
MTVIEFPKLYVRQCSDAPLAVFAHTLPELADADGVFDPEWLTNCILNTTIGLFAARRLGLPIAHLILTPEDRPSGEPALSVPGLKARPTEAVFSYEYPSIFSSALFNEYLTEAGISKLALFGFAANDVGLVSAIEAARRDCDMILLRDCSPLFSIDDCQVAESDAAIFGTIAYFASVMTLPDFIEEIAGKGSLSPAILPAAETLIDPETLKYLIGHSVGQANRLGLSACAGHLSEAAAAVSRTPNSGFGVVES